MPHTFDISDEVAGVDMAALQRYFDTRVPGCRSG